MELNSDEPGVVLVFDDFRQNPVRRHAGKAHAVLLQAAFIAGVNLIAVAMAFRDSRGAIDARHPAAARQLRWIRPQTHGAAEIAVGTSSLGFVAFDPFGHQPNDRVRRWPELGRIGILNSAQVAGGFDYGHLHAKADSKVRHMALTGELRGADFALGTPLAKAAWNKNAVDMLEQRRRIFALEYFALDPVEIDLHFVGDAAVRQRLDQR